MGLPLAALKRVLGYHARQRQPAHDVKDHS
jgi:hypothetical protein